MFILGQPACCSIVKTASLLVFLKALLCRFFKLLSPIWDFYFHPLHLAYMSWHLMNWDMLQLPNIPSQGLDNTGGKHHAFLYWVRQAPSIRVTWQCFSHGGGEKKIDSEMLIDFSSGITWGSGNWQKSFIKLWQRIIEDIFSKYEAYRSIIMCVYRCDVLDRWTSGTAGCLKILLDQLESASSQNWKQLFFWAHENWEDFLEIQGSLTGQQCYQHMMIL